MTKSLSALLISALLLSGCGQSRLNPLNWFGRAEPAQVHNQEAVNPLIPRRSAFSNKDDIYKGQLVAQIRGLKVERVPGGAILRVEALAATQGSWDVRMEVLNNGVPVEGVLSYELRALPSSKRVGPALTRRIVAATFVSDQDLNATRSLQVIGAENALISRR